MNYIKSNGLIAQFMGFKMVVENYRGINIIESTSGKTYDLHGLKYHSSFDWLIPAVKEIIPPHGWPLSGVKYQTAVINALQRADIDILYKAVVEFIEWYNKEARGAALGN